MLGKHKPTFDPAKLCGDRVVIENARDVVLTGNKLKQKLYRYHTGYPGGLKELQAKHVMRDTPERVIEAAVSGMLPKNGLRRKRMKELRVFEGEATLEA